MDDVIKIINQAMTKTGLSNMVLKNKKEKVNK